MKPVHILALVLAGAAGGAVLMRVVQRPAPVIPVAEIPSTTQVSAPATPQAPAPPREPVITEPAPPAAAEAAPAAAAQEPPIPPTRVHQSPPRHIASNKPSPMPPPPAHPRPLVVAQAQQPPSPLVAAQTPVETPAPLIIPPIKDSPMPQAPPAAPQPEYVTPPAPIRPEPHSVTLNAGLLIPVRLVDGLSSARNSQGDPFIATLDHELVVEGFVIAEKGARVEGRVVTSDRGTRARGGATLTVELIRLHTSDRQIVPIETDPFEKRMQPNNTEDIEKLGGGAALGAIIGAIAGGGKGAAIGAGVGGGAGAGDVLLTRRPATLPSETRIKFRLRVPVTLTEKIGD